MGLVGVCTCAVIARQHRPIPAMPKPAVSESSRQGVDAGCAGVYICRAGPKMGTPDYLEDERLT